MKTLLKAKYIKIIRDLMGNPGRSLLVIFALVIGLWGVGTIIVSYTILKNDLNENFQKTRPAHVILRSKNFNKTGLEFFTARNEIESADFRDFSLQRIEVYPGVWLPLWIYGVADFNDMPLAKIFPHKGASFSPDKPGEAAPGGNSLWIERNGMQVSNLDIGATPLLRVGSKNMKTRITGIVFDPAQAPATQDAFIYAYAGKKTFRFITNEDINNRLILRYRNVKSKADVEKLTLSLLDDLRVKGVIVESAEIPKFNEHPHQFQLNTIQIIDGIIGLLAFLMGMVLVSQLMSSILTRQTRQIGIMKAIGATSFEIFKIYLFIVLVFGAAAGLLAIPLAVVSGYAFAGFVAGILNFDILTKSLPHWLYIIFIAMALTLPVLFSLPALIKGMKISTLKALNDYGITQPVKASSGLRVSFLPPVWGLAFQNLFRRKNRLLVTMATMALGVAIFSTGFNVRAALAKFLFESKESMKYDVQVVLKEQVPMQTALAPFKNLENMKSFEVWNGGKGRLQSKIISTKNGVGIVALPYNTTLIQWDVISGRWLNGSNKNEIVINQQAAQLLNGPKPGDTIPITLGGKTLTPVLAGIVKEFDAPKIYMDKEMYNAAANPENLVNSIMFSARDRDYSKVIQFKQDIEQAIMPSNLSVMYVMSQAERAKIIFEHLNIILSILIFLSLLVLVVSAMGMASATGINIMERTREIGVLRAIGATPEKIYSLFAAEGFLLSAAGILLGLTAGMPMSYLASLFFGNLILGENTPLDFTFSFPGFLVSVAVTFLFGRLAAKIPAKMAVNVSTREALAYE